jgi:hypothetical protein
MKHIHQTTGDRKKTMAYVDWLAEYRTFEFLLPRQVGKTTTLVDCMQPNTLLLTYSTDMVDRIQTDFGGAHGRVATVGTFNDHRKFQDFKTKIGSIYIDEIQLLNKADLNSLYETLEAHDLLTDDFFILGVGTPTE